MREIIPIKSLLTWDDPFFKKIRGFLVIYNWFFLALILISVLVILPVSPLLYLGFLIAFAATISVTFMPLKWFKRLIIVSVPAYLMFIHIFLYYTGGPDSPYRSLYLLPVIFAALLFSYPGGIITVLFTIASHIILEEATNIRELIFYFSTRHFYYSDIPFFLITAFLGILSAFISRTMKEDRDALARLFHQVERAKKEWEKSFDAINNMIFINDSEYRITRVNTAAAERLKLRPQDIIGKHFYELVHGLHGPILPCPHKRTLETGEIMTIEVEEPTLNAIFEVTTYPLFDEKGKVHATVHYMKDITARKRAEAALKRELNVTRVLHDTDLAILSTLEKEEVFKQCLSGLGALVDCDYVSIATFDSERDEFKVEDSLFSNTLTVDKRIIPLDSTIPKEAVLSKISRYCPDMKDEDLLIGDQWLKEKGIRSLLIVPLIAKGSPVGVLNIGSLQRDRFNKNDIELAGQYGLQIAIAIYNANLYEGMNMLFMDTITSLSSVIDTKSPWTQAHSTGAVKYAISIAMEMGLDESFIKDLRIAALLHDIGKVGIDSAILNKPSTLSTEEFELVKQHPLKSVSILEPVTELKNIIPIIKHHHEWWDGTGYPAGLSGNMIPLVARIICVADAFDSMRTNRPYRRALSLEEAKEELIKFSGKQFDPQVAAVFIRVLENNLKKESPAKIAANP